MPKPSATTPFHLIYGGDPYLNEQTVRDLRHQAQRKHPDAETIELDATNADHYAFDEAVSPSLLSERSIVSVSNLQNADDKLGETMVAYCKQAVNNPAEASIVICQHEGGIKGKRLIDQLTKAGAVKETVADLKKAEAKLNFTIQYATVKRNTGRTIAPPHGQGAPSLKTQSWLLQSIMLPTITCET